MALYLVFAADAQGLSLIHIFDCVIIDKAPAQEYVKANPGLTILEGDWVNEDYSIGVAKGNTAMLEAVNGVLEELIADGTVQSIIDTYITAG